MISFRASRAFSYKRCLVLHPVHSTNHGPQMELQLAEEAVGLAKSMRWDVIKGPLWDEVQSEAVEETLDQLEEMRSKRPENGQYVYGESIQGVWWKNGIIPDLDEDNASIYDEWKNEKLRDCIARSSLMKLRNISGGTYLTKGKLNEIGDFVKNENIDVVFVNDTLSPMQINKLQKRLNDFRLGRVQKLQRYNIRSANKSDGEPTDISSSSGYATDEKSLQFMNEEIKVID